MSNNSEELLIDLSTPKPVPASSFKSSSSSSSPSSRTGTSGTARQSYIAGLEKETHSPALFSDFTPSLTKALSMTFARSQKLMQQASHSSSVTQPLFPSSDSSENNDTNRPTTSKSIEEMFPKNTIHSNSKENHSPFLAKNFDSPSATPIEKLNSNTSSNFSVTKQSLLKRAALNRKYDSSLFSNSNSNSTSTSVESSEILPLTPSTKIIPSSSTISRESRMKYLMSTPAPQLPQVDSPFLKNSISKRYSDTDIPSSSSSEANVSLSQVEQSTDSEEKTSSSFIMPSSTTTIIKIKDDFENNNSASLQSKKRPPSTPITPYRYRSTSTDNLSRLHFQENDDNSTCPSSPTSASTSNKGSIFSKRRVITLEKPSIAPSTEAYLESPIGIIASPSKLFASDISQARSDVEKWQQESGQIKQHQESKSSTDTKGMDIIEFDQCESDADGLVTNTKDNASNELKVQFIDDTVSIKSSEKDENANDDENENGEGKELNNYTPFYYDNQLSSNDYEENTGLFDQKLTTESENLEEFEAQEKPGTPQTIVKLRSQIDKRIRIARASKHNNNNNNKFAQSTTNVTTTTVTTSISTTDDYEIRRASHATGGKRKPHAALTNRPFTSSGAATEYTTEILNRRRASEGVQEDDISRNSTNGGKRTPLRRDSFTVYSEGCMVFHDVGDSNFGNRGVSDEEDNHTPNGVIIPTTEMIDGEESDDETNMSMVFLKVKQQQEQREEIEEERKAEGSDSLQNHEGHLGHKLSSSIDTITTTTTTTNLENGGQKNVENIISKSEDSNPTLKPSELASTTPCLSSVFTMVDQSIQTDCHAENEESIKEIEMKEIIASTNKQNAELVKTINQLQQQYQEQQQDLTNKIEMELSLQKQELTTRLTQKLSQQQQDFETKLKAQQNQQEEDFDKKIKQTVESHDDEIKQLITRTELETKQNAIQHQYDAWLYQQQVNKLQSLMTFMELEQKFGIHV